VKVLDLGLARVNQPDQLVLTSGSELDLTVSGSFVGTVDYVSPEQAYDPRMADSRSDIYSLGCTLHYLLTGKAPFGGQTFMERLLGHRERPIPSLFASRHDVPEALETAFRSLLAKSPHDRPQTMAAVAAELEECRKLKGRKKSRPLMVFDDRDEETRKRDATYQIGPSTRDSAPPRSELLSNVFVRSRSSGDDEDDGIDDASARQTRQLVVTLLIVAVAIVLGWFFFK
jgi:eukaryotic-like serine/threonine-protein kinase